METKNLQENRDSSAQRMKYLQLVDHILQLIERSELQLNERLPSLKQFEHQFGISKETVLKGLNYLLEKGIIESVYRKGYYVRKKSVDHSFRVFLLLDKMNLMRDKFYHTLFEAIKDKADIDVYFHHHNSKVFEKLITENIHSYTHFVIAAYLKEDVSTILNSIPAPKRILIDFDQAHLQGNYSSIYQDFKSDIYDALSEVEAQLAKYKQLILIVPPEAFHARLVIEGFLQFCQEHQYPYIIQHEISSANFYRGNVYITFSRYDTDDVALIKLARRKKYRLGEDIGLISYNDTDVKEILEGGITVISSDFEAMAKKVAETIEGKKIIRHRNPTKLILRNSL
ncbi:MULTISPECIES: GntR family transcriptional regulator [Olivibacter]|jgi:DNA-binding GntR family transcriptional regulator|uniref:GntR family transcriptional regulator n=1 Tax=Olivibacter oleidegradans TaxID=760123 RepID=A0ABV6HGQ7_9SPHI|nr:MULTISPECIES: GntR family transcriptional regulator [Olivibacter]MDM8176714.1 GntR family transcriptional regulator [Olivibacter sp. 47]QEL00536.1 GntR family transcriptional regulator [Olivibacter sp. LS-1]